MVKQHCFFPYFPGENIQNDLYVPKPGRSSNMNSPIKPLPTELILECTNNRNVISRCICQKVWYSYEVKVLESPALHIETRKRSLITENNFWLISKCRSERDPIIHFLWSVFGFKSFFFTLKKCDQNSLAVQSSFSCLSGIPTITAFPKRFSWG